MAWNGIHAMRNLIRTANRSGGAVRLPYSGNAGLLFGGNRHLIPVQRLFKIGQNIVDAFKTG